MGIGGINPENCYDVVLAGTHGVAVVSAICSANDPYNIAKRMYQMIIAAKKDTQRQD